MICIYIFRNIKWYITIDVMYLRDITEGEARTSARLGTVPEILVNEHDIDLQIETACTFLNVQK